MCILVFTGVLLLYNMKTKYNFEYHKQKYYIASFLLSETSAIVLFTFVSIINVIKLDNGHRDNFNAEDAFEYNGLRSKIQALGFIYIKKSRDPLFGI